MNGAVLEYPIVVTDTTDEVAAHYRFPEEERQSSHTHIHAAKEGDIERRHFCMCDHLLCSCLRALDVKLQQSINIFTCIPFIRTHLQIYFT